MYGVFKFLLYLGVVAGIAGFFFPQFADHPQLASLPPETGRYLSFGGLGLVVLGLIGRTATKPDPSQDGSWQ
jgi:hypothetical protein